MTIRRWPRHRKLVTVLEQLDGARRRASDMETVMAEKQRSRTSSSNERPFTEQYSTASTWVSSPPNPRERSRS